MEKFTIYQGKFLTLSKKGKWEYAQRSNASGCVGILAVTDQQEILLVEQFRIPVNRSTIELTAGLIGDEDEFIDESIAECANRELVEETGYKAGQMTHLLTSPSSAGLTDETVHLYFARNLTKVGQGGGVAGENITVHKVKVEGLQSWCDKQIEAGKVVDAKIFSCLYLAKDKGLI